jgi:hypothetical protein
MHGSRSKIPRRKSCPYIYDVKFLALLGDPYIYGIRMLRVKFVHVSVPGCHPQGFFQIKGSTRRPLWDDENIEILKDKIEKHKITKLWFQNIVTAFIGISW